MTNRMDFLLNKILLQPEIASTELDSFATQLNTLDGFLNEKEWAGLFVDTLYLKTVLQFVIEDHWLQNRNSTAPLQFDRFIKKYFEMELKPLRYLHPFFESSAIDNMHGASKAIARAERHLLEKIKSKSYEFKRLFMQSSLQRMSELFEHEFQMNSDDRKKVDDARLSLYRTFDVLDEIFELNYLQNEVASIDQKERLYENAGLGVQSSYATTLLALRYLNLPKGSRFIDLGSGYGRIGLVLGLMRPDIQFIGYEFVKERVDIANKASTHFQLNSHVQFRTQDLSQSEFKIPVADTYYIFDSFAEASYAIILEQLQEMTQHRRITVVTKGNAKLWLKNQYWLEPQEFNGGNLCFFRSRISQRIA